MVTRFTKIVAVVAFIYMSLAVCALGWVLYEVTTAGQSLSDRVNAIADKNAKLQSYTKLATLMEETAPQRQELVQFVLTKDKTSSFLTEIESLGASQGVSLTTNSLKVIEKEGSFDDLVIQFKIEGREDLVQKMIALLETLPYHSQVSSLTFALQNTGAIESNVELTITLLKYEN